MTQIDHKREREREREREHETVNMAEKDEPNCTLLKSTYNASHRPFVAPGRVKQQKNSKVIDNRFPLVASIYSPSFLLFV
jgi:hypothetical protein